MGLSWRDGLRRRFVTACIALALSACASTPKPDPAMADPIDIREIKQRAETAYQYGNRAEAIFLYQEALSQEPDSEETQLKLGYLYIDLGNGSAAGPLFERVLEKTPRNGEALSGRGLARLLQGEYEGARKALTEAIEVDPQQWRAASGLGILADIDGDHAAAQGHFRSALAIRPAQGELWNNLGYSQLLAGEHGAAEQSLWRAVRSADPRPRWRNNLAIALANQIKYEEAVEVLTPVMERYQAENNVGFIAMNNRDYRAAISLFERAIEGSPTYYIKARENLERARRLDKQSR